MQNVTRAQLEAIAETNMLTCFADVYCWQYVASDNIVRMAKNCIGFSNFALYCLWAHHSFSARFNHFFPPPTLS